MSTQQSQTREEQQEHIERQQRRYTQRLSVPEGEERYSGVVTKFSGTYGFAVVLGGKYDGQTLMVNQANILTSRENVYRTLNNGEHIEFSVKANEDGRIQALNVSAPGGYCLLCETNPSLGQRRYTVRSQQAGTEASSTGSGRGRGRGRSTVRVRGQRSAQKSAPAEVHED
jgi:predicted regulator of Ras-like GTPase activity (Roadblock/LC7/MglB family)